MQGDKCRCISWSFFVMVNGEWRVAAVDSCGENNGGKKK
jgi:hypothetical protein